MKNLNVNVSLNDIIKGLDFAKAQTDAFHEAFGHPVAELPTELTEKEVKTRINFIGEELVEALAAVSDNDGRFIENVTGLIAAIMEAERKSMNNGDVNAENKLVALADAFTDINVFTQGTFTMMGVEPQPLYDIVMNANMAKLGADGKPIYRESDGKIMKPEGWLPPEPQLEAEIERQKNVLKSCK